MQDESLRVLDHEVLASCVFWTGVVAAASLLFSVGLVSLSLKMWQIAAGIAVGAMVIALTPLRHRADRGLPVIQPSRLPIAGAGRAIPPHSRPGHGCWTRRRTPRRRHSSRMSLEAFVTRWLGNANGYVETLPDGRRRILPGHTFATIQFVLTFVVFWLALYAKSRPADPASYMQSPARDRGGIPGADGDVHRAALTIERVGVRRGRLFFRPVSHTTLHDRSGRSADDGSVVTHRLPRADHVTGTTTINWRRQDRS